MSSGSGAGSRYPARLAMIRELRQALGARLAAIGVPATDIEAFQLAASEIATNAIRHGAPAPQEIGFAVDHDQATIWVDVLDDGGRFDPLQDGLPIRGPLDPGELGEAGLGLILLRTLFPLAQYRPGARFGEMNRCRLIRRLTSLARPRILVIDDSAAMRLLVKASLGDRYDVVVLDSAAVGIELLHRSCVDLIICDVHMPGMGGLQFREHLAALAIGDLPFIFLTGDRDAAMRARAGALGVDDFLLKPIAPDALLGCVARVIKRRRQMEALLGPRLAERLTDRLRPRLPARLGPLRAEVRTRAIEPGGGDFLFQHDDAAGTLLVLGDIMGHGADAKLLAHSVTGILRGVVHGSVGVVAPAALLNLSQQAVIGDPSLADVLVACAVLRVGADAAVDLALAGHPRPVLCSATDCHPVGNAGPILGLPDASWEPAPPIHMTEGDRLVLFSDGVSEGHDLSHRGTLGITDLSTMILAQRTADAGDLADRIMAAVEDGPDDSTVVILDRDRAIAQD